MDYSIESSETTIQGIDNIFPDELAPGNVTVLMNIKVYRTADNDPVALGIAPGGDNANAQKEFTESPYITIEIRDKITDKTIVFLPRAWLYKRSGSGDAESVITESWSIKSIGYFGPGSQPSGIIPVLKNIFG